MICYLAKVSYLKINQKTSYLVFFHIFYKKVDDLIKPIIGVVGRSSISTDGTKEIYINDAVRKAIIQKGGIPLLILPTQNVDYECNNVPRLTKEEKKDLISLINLCDGILLPGGYKWYEYDEFIYQIALEKNIPILGICAGMQTMCKVDIDSINIVDPTILNQTKINHYKPNTKYVHNINILAKTRLKKIIKKKIIKVNSRHKYHIDQINNLKASAYSEDGLIEAVEYSDKYYCIGVQWHPENMLEYDESANKIFESFIKACKNN